MQAVMVSVLTSVSPVQVRQIFLFPSNNTKVPESRTPCVVVKEDQLPCAVQQQVVSLSFCELLRVGCLGEE